MALDLTPEQKTVGQGNFHRAVGKLAALPPDMTRRQFMQGMLAAATTLPLGAAAYYGYNHNFGERPVRAALIGAGDEGGVLVGEHNPRFLEFVAYCDIRPFNQRRIFEGEQNGPRKGFNFHYGRDSARRIQLREDYKQILADPNIEAIVIALPLNLHAPVAIEAMQAGKHVLCEKLMAWNVKQCKQMIREADRLDKVLAIGHQRHYSMLYAHASEVVKSNILGDIRHIRALWHRNGVERDPWRKAVDSLDEPLRTSLRNYAVGDFHWKDVETLVRWRLYRETGGGLMAELGSHQLDACSIFLGKTREHHVRPIAVTGVGGKNFYNDDREIEDHVFCTYEFPGKNYDAQQNRRDPQGNARYNDVVTLTYSSISTNDFEPYGECVMGSKGTLIVEKEEAAYLFSRASRTTAVTVGAAGGQPVLSASASTPPDAADRRAQDVGQASLGHAPPSKGYREEMEHFAYIIRNRDQGMDRDRENLKPRCDGRAAMDDAIMALVANIAMRDQKRIEFHPDWFDPAKDRVPEEDHPVHG